MKLIIFKQIAVKSQLFLRIIHEHTSCEQLDLYFHLASNIIKAFPLLTSYGIFIHIFKVSLYLYVVCEIS